MWIKRILLITITIIGGFLSCSAQGKIERPSVHPKVTKGNINGHAYVDLGLPSGIKWATCNVGANYEYEIGNYYSWGECNTKELYDPKHGDTLGLNLDDISGNTKYDVARKIWGGSWRVPTMAEIKELIQHCTYERVQRNGRVGCLFTGKNGNQIFLPACNCAPIYEFQIKNIAPLTKCYYWTSTPSDRIYNNLAYYLNDYDDKLSINDGEKSLGLPIRPVSK